MTIHVECESCFQTYQVKDQLAGKRIRCRECGEAIRVPAPGSEEPTELEFFEPDRDEPPRPQPAKRRSQASAPKSRRRMSNLKWFLLAGGVFAGCLLFMCAVTMFSLGVGRGGGGDPTAAWPVGDVPLPSFPEPPPAVTIEPGVQLSKVRLAGSFDQPGQTMELWLYLPEGDHAAGSLPCVLVAPAGTNLLTGMDLGDGDQPEHLPYVRAGFAVVAYSLDGGDSDIDAGGDDELVHVYRRFVQAQAGLVNARNALEFVLARVPQVDPSRIYVAGHSSAGTLALLFAEHEPRLKGCIAYAPCADVEARLAEVTDNFLLRTLLPGVREFVTRSSPKTHAAKITCPVFLFHALDDSNVPASESQAFVQLLESHGKQATLATVPTGDHYEPMLTEGIPQAIAWMQQQP